jgi:hypothetical protein
MIKKYLVLLAACAACLAPASGLDGQIGDPAAPLKVKQWMKGGPVEVKAGTNIFVVEIFTPSSASSRASITNLNEIQKRYKSQGVVVVGVVDASLDTIKEFMRGAGAKIEYAVAADDQRATSRTYMLPVRQVVVPCAFIVGKDGKLLWHGHPQRGLDKVLDQILAGRYNVDQARKLDDARTQMSQYLDLAHRGDGRMEVAGRRLLAVRTNNAVTLCDLAYQIATDPRIVRRDFVLAKDALDQAEKLAPTNTTQLTLTRAVLLFETGKREEGLAQAKQAVASAQGKKEKAIAQSCLRTIQARFDRPKSSETNSPAKKP